MDRTKRQVQLSLRGKEVMESLIKKEKDYTQRYVKKKANMKRLKPPTHSPTHPPTLFLSLYVYIHIGPKAATGTQSLALGWWNPPLRSPTQATPPTYCG